MLQRTVSCAAAACIVVAASQAVAGDWQWQPRFSTSITHTDNATFQRDARESDTIAQIRPGLSVRGQGARLQAALEYNLDRRQSLQDVIPNGTQHQLQAQGSAELVEDHGFIDASAFRTQVNIDNRLGNTFNNRVGNFGNLANVSNVVVSPYWRQHFSSFADAEVRGTYSVVKNDSQDVVPNRNLAFADTTNRSLGLTVTGGRQFSLTPWSLQLNASEVEFGGGATSEFNTVRFNLGYRFSPSWLFDVTLGYDQNEFASVNEVSGETWLLGGEWTPSERITVDFSAGQRFFGTTKQGSVRYRRRHTELSVNYSENVQTNNRLFNGFSPLSSGRFTNFAGLNPGRFGQVGVRQDTPTLNDQVFLLKRLDARLNWQRRRNNASFQMFRFDREDQGERGLSEDAIGFTFRFGRTLSRQASVNLFTSWQTRTFGLTNEESRFIRISPTYSYRVSENLDLNLSYSRFDTEGEGRGGGFGGFDENQVTVTLTYLP